MTARGDRTRTIAAAALVVAAAAISWLAWGPAPASRCTLPSRSDALPGFSGAVEVKDRMEGQSGDVLVFLQATWPIPGEIRSKDTAQILVTRRYSDFLNDPYAILPGAPLPEDQVDHVSLERASAQVPVRLRANPRPPVPAVLGWLYAFDDQPVTSPVAYLLRHAFSHPFEKAPPLTLISVESMIGTLPVDTGQQIVLRRLDALWRDWEASCRT